MQIADTVTVMRNGRTIGTYEVAKVSTVLLTSLIMGSEPGTSSASFSGAYSESATPSPNKLAKGQHPKQNGSDQPSWSTGLSIAQIEQSNRNGHKVCNRFYGSNPSIVGHAVMVVLR